MKIGDKILFKDYIPETQLPCGRKTGFHTDLDNIPSQYIIHGSTVLKSGELGGVIEDFYKDFVIISYTDKHNSKVQLGFYPDAFILSESVEPIYEIY